MSTLSHSPRETARLLENQEAVKTYVRPERKISPGICPGCLRKRHGFYKTLFCDHFCEELWRKDQERKASQAIPWAGWTKNFFGGRGVSDTNLLAPLSLPAYGKVKVRLGPGYYGERVCRQ